VNEIVAAFKVAMKIGLAPSEFWRLTPWLFSHALEAAGERRDEAHNSAAFMMWHGALLTRSKEILPLKRFLANAKKPVNRIDENAIIARLKAYQDNYRKAPPDGASSQTNR